jgi:transcriptional regulator with GAF, ATPase, and Fis domain
MDPTPHFPAEQCLMLNDVARIIASRRNLSDLFHDLAERLHRLIDFSYLGVMLYDPAQHVLRLRTLEVAERKHILAVLEETGWVLGGPHGAAVRLGMKRSTLQFRLRKLGLTRPGK